MTIEYMKMTNKEKQLLLAINEGMDFPGEGWLNEISPFDCRHVTAGVVGSLVSKWLITCEVDKSQPILCHWVMLTDEGVKVVDECLKN